MSDFTRVHHPDSGGYAEVPSDSLELWAARGWEPVSGPRPRAQADAEQAARDDEAQDAAREVASHVPDHTVEEVLARVGADPHLARAALDAEQDSDHPRSTLVAGLQAVTEKENTNG